MRPIVTLRLDVDGFDETPFLKTLERCKASGIAFNSIAQLGDTEPHRRKLYELNKLCSKDIPARGEFFTYDEFCRRRFGQSYTPEGVIIARSQDTWVGLSATSIHGDRGFAFNEMTGVIRDYRRQGLALALKLLGIRHIRSLGLKWIYTIHDVENESAIQMNKRLGYKDAETVPGGG